MHDPRDPELESLLGKLNRDEQHKPWFATIGRDLRDSLFPQKLPPLQVTSAPIPVQDIWGFSDGRRAHSGISSLAIHAAIIGMMLWLGTNKFVQEQVARTAEKIDIAPYLKALRPAAKSINGGGGGGEQAPTPTSKGALPKIALKQLVPPTVTRLVEQPKLELDPTIIAQPDAPIPQVDMKVFGNPLASVTAPSGGPGSRGGIGDGTRGGVGPGDGPGSRPGSNGNIGGDVYRGGGAGVIPPFALFKPEPEYSEDARKAKLQGMVTLQIVVDANGNPRDIKVVHSLGLGLDEKAIEVVQKWRFRAGKVNGKPVPMRANVEISFRLL